LQQALSAGVKEAARVARGPATIPAITEAANAIQKNVAQAIFAGRTLARTRGHSSIQKEMGLIESYAPELGGELHRVAGSIASDQKRANYVASSFSRYWSESAIMAASDGESASVSASQATKRQEFRIKMVAVTETSNAWNDERQGEIVQLEQEKPISRIVTPLLVFSEWDAAMDRRTCDICETQHGKIRPAGISFSVGDPPVHPNCRCGLMLVVLPAYYEWEDEAAA